MNTIKQLRSLCDKRKASLIKRAKLRGICEKFGDKEQREIDAFGASIAHNSMAPWDERQQVAGIVSGFCDWACDYDGR